MIFGIIDKPEQLDRVSVSNKEANRIVGAIPTRGKIVIFFIGEDVISVS